MSICLLRPPSLSCADCSSAWISVGVLTRSVLTQHAEVSISDHRLSSRVVEWVNTGVGTAVDVCGITTTDHGILPR